MHPVYQKRVRVTTKYQAHDENEVAQVGDTVLLKPSRPLSKSKRCAPARAAGSGNACIAAGGRRPV